MSSVRVHVVVAAEDRARYRAAASREGLNLSEWLRAAADDRLSRGERARLDTPEDLDAFFSRLDDRDEDNSREPDWHELGDELGHRTSDANPAP